jgi:hypothetical protein
MTEQQAPEATAPAPQPFPVDQMNQIKMSLINSLQGVYTGFLTQISQLPCNLEIKKIALKEFDTGYLWFKEAIFAFDFSGMQMIKPEVIPDPTQEQAKVEEPASAA